MKPEVKSALFYIAICIAGILSAFAIAPQ